MNSAVTAVNSFFGSIFSVLVGALGGLGAAASLCIVSAIAGVLLLLVFGRVSNQKAIRRVKERIHAAILESIIFRSDLKLSLKAQVRMFGLAFVYIARALPPLLILIPICIPILAQLYRFYGSEPLVPARHAMLEIDVARGTDVNDITLSTDAGLELAGPVRDKDGGKLFYRVSPREAGVHAVAVSAKGAEIGRLTVDATPGWSAAGRTTQVSTSWLSSLLFPNDGSWRFSPEVIEGMTLSYRDPGYPFLFMSLSWVVIFLIVSLAAGLVASKVLKIEV